MARRPHSLATISARAASVARRNLPQKSISHESDAAELRRSPPSSCPRCRSCCGCPGPMPWPSTVGKRSAADDPVLRFGLQDPRRGDLQVEVLRQRDRDQPLQRLVVEHRRPSLVGNRQLACGIGARRLASERVWQWSPAAACSSGRPRRRRSASPTAPPAPRRAPVRLTDAAGSSRTLRRRRRLARRALSPRAGSRFVRRPRTGAG